MNRGLPGPARPGPGKWRAIAWRVQAALPRGHSQTHKTQCSKPARHWLGGRQPAGLHRQGHAKEGRPAGAKAAQASRCCTASGSAGSGAAAAVLHWRAAEALGSRRTALLASTTQQAAHCQQWHHCRHCRGCGRRRAGAAGSAAGAAAASDSCARGRQPAKRAGAHHLPGRRGDQRAHEGAHSRARARMHMHARTRTPPAHRRSWRRTWTAAARPPLPTKTRRGRGAGRAGASRTKLTWTCGCG